jgi:hypothetical protein
MISARINTPSYRRCQSEAWAAYHLTLRHKSAIPPSRVRGVNGNESNIIALATAVAPNQLCMSDVR